MAVAHRYAHVEDTYMKVAVLGSGAGALAMAADMSRAGRRTVMADFEDGRAGLDPVAATGRVIVDNGGRGAAAHAVTVAGSIPEALDGAELVVVAAPSPARQRWAQAIAPHATADQTVLVVGEGGGAIVARRAIEPPTVVAESNTLPVRASPAGPGAVSAVLKPGGVLIAALPPIPPGKARVAQLIGDVWPHTDVRPHVPHVTVTDTVWTTVLTSYDALEGAAADVIRESDAELMALRRAFGSREARGYQDFLAGPGPDTASPSPSPGPGGTASEGHGALVLASSLGRAAGVRTPATDGLIDEASAALGRNLRDEGPTLATLGLGGLDVTGLIGFARSGYFP